MYCLWLNGKKVFTLQQLRASFDAEAVELYCLGGSLARWLRDCGEPDAAEKVEQIDFSRSISRQLAEIFGVPLPKIEEQPQLPAAPAALPATAANGSFALPSSFTSDTILPQSSFFISFDTTSFGFSAAYTSFFTTSFGGYEHEYEYESGSFATNSFSIWFSSFSAETAFLTGSFSSGSFNLGSFTSEYGSFTAGYGSFPLSGSFSLIPSSFSPESAAAASTASAQEKEPQPLTPQQKFELNLSSNPLNRFGYGIHLI